MCCIRENHLQTVWNNIFDNANDQWLACVIGGDEQLVTVKLAV
jgi:hypothetical protein